MVYHHNIVDVAKANENFRAVVATNKHSQLVVMALQPGEDIGAEVHQVDQVLVFVAGNGTAILDGKEKVLAPGDVVVIPAGTKHNFVNSRESVMKLYTVYAPPEHKHGTIHPTKADAIADERDHADS